MFLRLFIIAIIYICGISQAIYGLEREQPEQDEESLEVIEIASTHFLGACLELPYVDPSSEEPKLIRLPTEDEKVGALALSILASTVDCFKAQEVLLSQDYLMPFHESISVFAPNLYLNIYKELLPSIEKFLVRDFKNIKKLVIPGVFASSKLGDLDVEIILSQLAMMTHIDDLDLSGCNLKDLSVLAKLPHLRHLSLEFCSVQMGFSGLKELKNLESLNLGSTDFNEFEVLSSLKSLNTLSLDRTSISSTKTLGKVLETLPIKDLNLSHTFIKDLSFLSKLSSLESLYLEMIPTTEFSSLKSLQNPEKLVELYLKGSRPKDLSFLQNLTGLRRLGLGATGIGDLYSLKNSHSLRWIEIENNQITDLSPLMGNRSLYYLNASNNKIKKTGGLSLLSFLTELHLDHNFIGELDSFDGLINLKHLNLSHNHLRNIAQLRPLTSLDELDLSDNRIEDISALVELKKLQSIDLSNNGIHDISAVANVDSLTDVRVDRNPVDDIEPAAKLLHLRRFSVSYGNSKRPFSGTIDLEPFKFHPSLESFYLENYPVRNVSVLSSISKLSHLSLVNVGEFNLGDIKGEVAGQLRHLDISRSKPSELSNLDQLNPAVSAFKELSEFRANHVAELLSATHFIPLQDLTTLELAGTQLLNLEALTQLRHLGRLKFSLDRGDSAYRESVLRLRKYLPYVDFIFE